MLHAAALLTGLMGLLLALSSDWRAPQTLIVGGAGALLALLWISRMGGADAESAPYFRVLRLSALLARQAGVAADGALRVARMALAADVTLKPALVRIKTRGRTAGAQTAFAHFINNTPGSIVVDMDADGMLILVLQEDAV
ncbi:MAG: Na+/H+ antiporter subunit E, partial [Hyphomonadaceae bacterium]